MNARLREREIAKWREREIARLREREIARLRSGESAFSEKQLKGQQPSPTLNH